MKWEYAFQEQPNPEDAKFGDMIISKYLRQHVGIDFRQYYPFLHSSLQRKPTVSQVIIVAGQTLSNSGTANNKELQKEKNHLVVGYVEATWY